MSNSAYQVPNKNDRHGRPRRLSDQHRRMLEDESGISPERIIARGVWTETDPVELIALGFAPSQCRREMGPFLVWPEYSVAGVLIGYKIRPDYPRTGNNGKPVKYENPARSRLHFDCPPGEHHKLKDTRIRLGFTEGGKKADAAASKGMLYISVPGVYGFLRNKVTIPDLDEIDFDGRQVDITYDADVIHKPGVADAMTRIANAAEVRGASVNIVHLAELNRGKGLDDVLVAGVTPEELAAVTRPWEGAFPAEEPGEVTLVDRLQARLQRLERDYARLEKDNHALVRLVENTHLTQSHKIVLVRTGRLAMEAKAKAGTDTNGNVRLEPSAIAHDYRPKNHEGQYNPRDGSRIALPRKNVPKVLRDLRLLAPLSFVEQQSAKTDPITKKHYMNDILIEPPDALYSFLKPFALYEPGEQVNRQKRTPPPPKHIPCPHCHEVHDYDVTTMCQGCEKVVATRVIDRTTVPDVIFEPAAPEEVDTLSTKEPQLTLVDTLSPPYSSGASEEVDKVSPPPRTAASDPPWPLQRGTYVLGRAHVESAGNDRRSA